MSRFIRALSSVYALVVAALFLCQCATLALPGNPRCFACGNLFNGTAAEDPKCWFGPCAPNQHDAPPPDTDDDDVFGPPHWLVADDAGVVCPSQRLVNGFCEGE